MPVTTLRPDHYENSAADRITNEGKYSPGETVGERDSGDIHVRTTSGWLPIRISGAALVATTKPGIARNRWVNVAHGTLPIEATSGVFKAFTPGVKNVFLHSIYLVAGPVPLTTTNWRVRYAIDSPDDSIDALLLPVTEPTADGDADIGQVFSFNVEPIVLPHTLDASRVIWLRTPPEPIPIYTGDDPILRVGFVHNLGTGVTIQLGLSATEDV